MRDVVADKQSSECLIEVIGYVENRFCSFISVLLHCPYLYQIDRSKCGFGTSEIRTEDNEDHESDHKSQNSWGQHRPSLSIKKPSPDKVY